MKVVVFGASGNIGTSLLTRLAGDRNIERVTAVSRRPPTDFAAPAEWIAADITSDPLERIVDGADAVFHLAWEIQPSHDRNRLWRTNIVGSRRVFEAAGAAGASSLIHGSSVGVYSPGPKEYPVDEAWNRTGVATSTYSRHKAEVERMLDSLEDQFPRLRIVRIRPGLVFKSDAAASIHRLFVGRIPRSLMVAVLAGVFPRGRRGAIQVIHADDVAAALVAVLGSDLQGPFNLATEPVVNGPLVARVLRGRTVPVPAAALRMAAAAGWRSRLSASEPGWIDLAAQVPLMSTRRAREALGWEPRFTAEETVGDLFAGLSAQKDGPTPALMRHPPPIAPKGFHT